MIKFINGLFKKNPKSAVVTTKEISSKNNLSRRELLTEKFFRNLTLIEDFKLTYECYCDISDTWNAPAFGDSNITNRQYYETLKQISDKEYSDDQCEAIKIVEIHENAVENYIVSLDSQYNNLKLLCDELKAKEDAILDSVKKLKR